MTNQNETIEQQMEALRAEVSEMKAAERKKARGRKRLGKVIAYSMLSVALVATVAVAAPSGSLTCTDNADLFCFSPNTPARASEINHNFQKTKAWVDLRVNKTGSDVVTINSAPDVESGSGGALVINDEHSFTLRLDGNEIESNDSNGLYLNWNDNYPVHTGGALNVAGDILSTEDGASDAPAQLGVSTDFVFRDTGGTWLRLNSASSTGGTSTAYADLAVDDLYVAGELTVTGALALTNQHLSGEYTVTARGEGATETRTDLYSISNSFCFLTRVRVGDDNDEDDVTLCEISAGTTNWELGVWTNSDEAGDATCTARCFRFK
jgi:hypothetical protein